MHYLDKFKYCPACGSNRFEENDFKSKRCEDCGFTFYFNSASATAVIITNERGELLLCRRAFDPAKGTLDIIGGFVDPGESALEAIVREIKEETGIQVPPSELTFLFSLPNTYMYSGLLLHTCDSIFSVQIPSATTIHASDDVAECFWVSPADVRLADIGLDSIREAVRRYLSDRYFCLK
ncbi:MAG: NUDIX domain-containing protein [Bacteroidaceae bacterium]|nr:NUDIX domain-containing protein [Bacteroidaceae bacterium]